jgi:GTP-binding protein Era
MKAGFIGLIGLPNAGKSTLVNLLVGEKVSIVTSKPQTTRHQVLGILNDEDSQIIFADTPGEIAAEDGLNHFLQLEFEKSLKESDVLLAVLNMDANKFEDLEKIVNIVKNSGKPWLPIITKTDIARFSHRLSKLHKFVEDEGKPFLSTHFKRTTEQLREDILDSIKELLPESPQRLFDPELYTTQSVKDMTKEILREKCFESLHDEIPFGLAVDIRKFDEVSAKTVKVHADLILNKENHKPMVVGRGGEKIKHIGIEARKEIEKVIGRPVFLNLFVKVKKNWSKNENALKELGYGIES